jgi:hypothetical protein
MLKVTVEKNLKPLEDLARNARELDGRHEVSIADLLTPEFLGRCTRFRSADELFESSGFKVQSTDDFAAIPDTEWDSFICKNTNFATWQDMLQAAVKEWTIKRLGLR